MPAVPSTDTQWLVDRRGQEVRVRPVPGDFGVGQVSSEDDLPTGLDHEDAGRIFKLGYVTYEWVGDFYVTYREDGLPTV